MSSRFRVQDGTGVIVDDQGGRGNFFVYPGSSTAFATGTGIPTNGTKGYVPGCIWINALDTTVGANALYINVGTLASSQWTDVSFYTTQPGSALETLNQTTGTIPAGYLTAAYDVFILQTNATPGNQQVRTAAQMLADNKLPVGWSNTFRVTNTGAGTMTIVADAGATVTLTGTMTILQNTFRDFIIQFPTATTATITTTGTGTYS